MKVNRGRRKGESTSRDDILTAARRMFSELGFDGTSVRGVARAAGVDPSLVLYFFESKEGLFVESVDLPAPAEVAVPHLINGPRAEVGYRLASFAITVILGDDSRRTRILALIRSGAQGGAAAAHLRERLTREVFLPVAEQLGSDQAELRAALAMSQVSGLVFTRHVLELAPLLEAEPDTLVAAIAPTLQRYLVEPLS